MFQLLLSSYLSVAVVLAPSLCCCSLDSLFPSSAGTSACSHSGGCNSHASHDHGHANHESHSRRGHSHHAPSDAATQSERQEEQAPCDHQPGKCPCEQHRQTMAASHHSDVIGQNSVEWHNELFMYSAVTVLTLVEQDVASALRMGEFRPVSVYGREILRAYHKLQC
jgi:hypothetical protein